jgi:hypothetical protein
MRYLTALVSAACLVVLVPVESRAQGFTAGVKGGLNVSTLDVDDPANPDGEFDSRTDFLAGIWLQCGGIDWFTLQGEVIYSRNGAKAQGGDPALELMLDDIRVQVLFMARLGSAESRARPVLYAGPQVAFETRCRVDGEEAGEPTSLGCSSEELDEPIETNLVEFGLVFGGVVEIPLGKPVLQLDARYNLGLSNLNAGADASEVSVENRGWSFAAGLGLPFG